jgi:hypothetical protein
MDIGNFSSLGQGASNLLADLSANHTSASVDIGSFQKFASIILMENSTLAKDLKTQIVCLEGNISKLKGELKGPGDQRSESIW